MVAVGARTQEPPIWAESRVSFCRRGVPTATMYIGFCRLLDEEPVVLMKFLHVGNIESQNSKLPIS